MFSARFDDAASGTSFRLADPIEAHAAWSLADVPGIVAGASHAARAGRWVAMYLAYDAAPAFDHALRAAHDPATPYAWFGSFASRIDDAGPASDDGYSVSRWTPLVERDRYDKAFATVHDHIGAGDAYQVNLTFPMRAAFSGDPGALYADLVAAQEAGYACRIAHDDIHVVSVSPERFFAITDDAITTRPMKGTRPRGRWSDEDAERRDELETSDKDRAENLMIVDLIRNDLGRVAEVGTVHVDELHTVEAYRTVWQLTSQVSATLRRDVSLLDAFAALFPCGSVTGAPKAASMEVIADVEPHPRGVYCGAIGFLPPGDGRDGATFSVAIRTAVVHLEEGIVHYGVGGGVTWDSTVDGEYDEALAKALVLTTRSEPVGLIETLRWDDGWLWLDEHLARLGSSIAFLGLPADTDDVAAALDALGEVLSGPTKVRVLVDVDGTISVGSERIDGRFAHGPGPDADSLTLAVDFDPVDERNPALFHKLADRSPYETRLRRHGGADDVVLTNSHGLVTETTMGTIVCRFGDRWVTPPLGDGLLPGIMRAVLIDAGAIIEESITVQRLLDADAVAVVNSVRGWRSAVVIDPR